MILDLPSPLIHADSMAPKPTVSLLPVRPEHYDALFAQYSHPESVSMAAFVFGDPTDRSSYEERLEKLLADPDILYRCILANDIAVGGIASFLMEQNRELTYGIHPDFWNRGIATEALRLFLKEETTRPLHARAASDNGGSRRVLEKCGFEQTGTELSFAPARNRKIEESLYRLN